MRISDWSSDVCSSDLRDAPRRRWPWVVVAVVLAALLGGGGAWAYVQSQVPSYEVPALVGLSEDDARQLIEAEGYGWEIERRATREDGTTPGQVVGTVPAVRDLLREDGTPVLVVSEGNPLAAVPTDLVGQIGRAHV